MSNMKIFAGNASLDLGSAVANELGIKLGKVTATTFSDGEIRVKIEENVRGSDCFVVQSTCYPANNNLMELLFILDALRRSSPR